MTVCARKRELTIACEDVDNGADKSAASLSRIGQARRVQTRDRGDASWTRVGELTALAALSVSLTAIHHV